MNYGTLESDIQKCNSLGDVMLLGDFNSRTGNIPDFLEYHPDIDESDENVNSIHLTNRNSRDNVLNQFGKHLLELCCHSNLNILNGRTLGDVNGQYTSFQYNGAAVYYCIVNHEIGPKIM